MNDESRADLAVVIGRFQPFHLGHLALLQHALAVAPRALLVVGSAGGPRLAKNPFSADERIQSIRESLTPEQQARVSFATVRDYYDEPRWAGAVKAAVARESSGSIALVGFHKDDSSSYLSIFPEWRELALPRQAPIDGTALRRSYFSESDTLSPDLVAAVPPAIARFLEQFKRGPHFERLREELHALEESRKKYGSGPFVTVDAVVTQSDSILLVQRGRAPGKDLWALPGGFLDGSERLLTAAIRELREETELALSDTELRAALRGVAVFDHPQRSQRGRTITHAHYFALPPSEATPPRVTGADDAQAAQWVPLSRIPSMTFDLFEDHYQIIDHFLKVSTD
jgi:bifunctional NMN adenylyltransferase/nudix hydrolase